MDKEINNKYEMITVVKSGGVKKLKKIVPYYKKNLSLKSINVIAPVSAKREIEQIDGVIFVDETSVILGLNLNAVEDIIEEICGERKRGLVLAAVFKNGLVA